ncbi:MAG: sugar phosphate isomerase/epimerase [Fimbriimonadaceae bacterium]|nr:sugar phosphate isomerase/epimerase [Alphaproteobacteria bacterium]
MLLSLCNEVLRDHSFAEQCRIAAALGYGGLEVAPFTLADDPFALTDTRLNDVRRIAEDHGLIITGVHWLLVAPEGLSVTTDDRALRDKTLLLLQRLIHACAVLGGTVLVHGSPAQRLLAHAATPQAARANAESSLKQVAVWAEDARVTYCLEPLSAEQTDYVNTVSEAIEVIDAIGSPALKTMIDTASAGIAESEPVADVIRRWWPCNKLAHIQINDTNKRAPGQGDNQFLPILQALLDVGYTGPVAVEPFIYEPDGATTAAVAAGYVRGIQEALA